MNKIKTIGVGSTIKRKNFIEFLKTFNENSDAYLGVMYYSIYNEFPLAYRLYYNNDKQPDYVLYYDDFQSINREIKYKIDDRAFLENLIAHKEEFGLEIMAYAKYEYFIFGGFNDFTNNYDFIINLILSDDQESISTSCILYCTPENIDFVFDEISQLMEYSDKREKIEFGIAAMDVTGSLYTAWYQYSDKEIDIDSNYNDDLPYEKICSLIESNEKPELLLFYGEAGTGKSSIIKHLISKYKEKEFVFIDGSILLNASQEKLMSYFLENQNTVFVFEDCEKVLVNREHNYNPVMSTLLNITDGIIGDVLGIKIICTFNTSISNIDKALLRKGRLSLKYEFKKLDGKKVQKLLGKNVDMTLADIYNYENENDYSNKQTKKIGF